MMPPEIRCEICDLRLRGFFAGLSGPPLERLDQEKTVHVYQRGQVIFYEGNPALAVYCIHSGRVKFSKMGTRGIEETIRLLGPGDIMGYRAMMAGEPYAATAQALETAIVCTIPRETYVALMRESPDLALRLIAKLAREVRVFEEQVLIRTQEPVRQRTARLLLALLETGNPPGVTAPRITVPLSRSEMARFIGTTPETLSRTLHSLARQGIISLTRNEITVQNLAALEKLAGGPRSLDADHDPT